MATLYCIHGEALEFDSEAEAAASSICAYCCTPFNRGEYSEHCATSPSHLNEIEARARDREIVREKAHYGLYLGR